MIRYFLLLAGIVLWTAAGCGGEPPQPPKAKVGKPAVDDAPDEPPPQTEPSLDDESKIPVETGTHELKLEESGITFVVPGQWKQVKPETRIIEAEFELPRAEGDEYDGRLTLMSSLGDRDEMIGKRTSEFKSESGEPPARETMMIGGIEATIVDLRGEWRGPEFKDTKLSREGYRMLYVVVPVSPNSSFYAKLTGPRATIAAHEAAFREFLKSATISR
jgi:hypothetical protein